MCYYNSVTINPDQHVRLLELERKIIQLDLLLPVVNGFDYGNSIVIVPAEDCRWKFSVMEWGFIPPYLKTREAVNHFRFGYKDEAGRFHPPVTTLNATAEEILKPGKIYREAALKRRCLILSGGFYEWRHVFPLGKKGQPLKTAVKYPYRINVKGKDYFFMAGIWQPWTDRETGETIETFAIVTTAANRLMEQIHNSKKRMPVILSEQLAGEWISEGLTEERILEIAGSQFPAEEMEAYTVQKDFRTATDPERVFIYEELGSTGIDQLPVIESQKTFYSNVTGQLPFS